jgi:hypothetical protein
LPLADRWQTRIMIEPRVAEIPSPTTDLTARAEWLRAAMQGRWRDLGPELLAWRDALVASLLELPGDSVIVSHYVAINAAVGVATQDDRMVIFAPDNASVTVLETLRGELHVRALGASADTFVN